MWRTFFKRKIYDSSTGIQIFENRKYRWMTFSSHAIQSMINLGDLQSAALHYVEPLTSIIKLIPGDVCLLGLGGASVAHHIEPYMKVYTIDAIEINKEVIDLAKSYFFTDKLHNTNIQQDNAANYIRNNIKTYKHILVDLYNSTSYPKECCSKEFFKNCTNHLDMNGYLVINIANPDEQFHIFTILKELFKGMTLTIPINKCSNIVIICSNNLSSSSFISSLKEAIDIKKLICDQEWGYVAELY